MAITAWEQGIPLKIIPTGINYHSFTNVGKNVQLNFGEIISLENIGFKNEDLFGAKIQTFNSVLKSQLEKLVIQIKPVDETKIKQAFEIKVSSVKKILLFVPALCGYVLHAPLYLPVQKFAFKKFGKIDHYDSVVVGLLFLLYPFYLLLIAIIVYFLMGGWWWSSVFIMIPFMAWSYVQIKRRY